MPATERLCELCSSTQVRGQGSRSVDSKYRGGKEVTGVCPLIRVGWDCEGSEDCVSQTHKKGSPCACETITLCPRMVTTTTTMTMLIMINNNNHGNNNKFSKAVYRIEAITELI